MNDGRQLGLSFEPGLTVRHRTLEDCCSAVVHNSRIGVEGAAAHLDMAPSELSRRLNAHVHPQGEANNRPLRLSDMLGIMEATQDYRPIYWLVEKFLRDPDSTRTAAIQQLAQLVPIMQALIDQSAPDTSRVGRGKR